jgi:uncharacterized protein YkwD
VPPAVFRGTGTRPLAFGVMLPRTVTALIATTVLGAGATTLAPTATALVANHHVADPGLVRPGPDPRASEAKFEANVLKWTNKARKNHGRNPLKRGKCVDGFADPWAHHMARRQQLVHQSLGPILKRCKASRVAENIAYGYPTARATVRAWMHSAGHRANILNRAFTNLGVGAARDKNGTWWVVQDFAGH